MKHIFLVLLLLCSTIFAQESVLNVRVDSLASVSNVLPVGSGYSLTALVVDSATTTSIKFLASLDGVKYGYLQEDGADVELLLTSTQDNSFSLRPSLYHAFLYWKFELAGAVTEPKTLQVKIERIKGDER